MMRVEASSLQASPQTIHDNVCAFATQEVPAMAKRVDCPSASDGER
jgi:hypothetical protein